MNVHEGFHNLISTYRFETIFSRRFHAFFTKDNEMLWCHAAKCLLDFYSPTYMCTPLNQRLIPVRTLLVGSQPKMLSYTLDELFHMYCGMGMDDDNGLHVVAQEMLSLVLLYAQSAGANLCHLARQVAPSLLWWM